MYLFPVNPLSKQMCVMRRVTSKTHKLNAREFSVRMIKINDYLDIFWVQIQIIKLAR